MTINKPNQDNQEWMVVHTTYHLHEAQIIAGRLQSEGVAALVHQQAGASAMGIHIGSLGEILVLVHPKDHELALEILDPAGPDELPDETDRTIYGDLDDPEE